MKDISTSLIIDDAIQRLENLKKESTGTETAVESLYIVRAYCELLLKMFSDHRSGLGHSNVKQLASASKQVQPPNRCLPEDDEANGSSLLDF